MRSILLVTLAFVLPLAAAAQKTDENPDPPDSPVNSIAYLMQSRAPQLQAGFGSDHDEWILSSPQFDVLSAGLQTFLLKKYGYLGRRGPEAEPDRISPSFRKQAEPQAALSAGLNVKVTIPDAEIGFRNQSEACIAVSGQNIVVGYNDAGGNERVSYSRDGGATWRQTHLPYFPGWKSNIADPVVVAGPNGRFYHSYLAPYSFGQDVVAVTHSDDGGATWSAPTNATASVTSPNNVVDKDWMAVDNVPGSPYRGSVYVSWTMFSLNLGGPGLSSIQFARSTDGGRTWLQAIAITQLSPSEVQGNIVQGSYIAIGPNGEVYLSWFDSRVGGIRVSKSSDGGATFSDPATAFTRPNFGTHAASLSTGLFDIPPFGTIAVDTSSGPNRGTVYAAAHLESASGSVDVAVTRSTDGGATWSDPIPVKNVVTNTDRFEPDIAVADNGNVGVIFYDRRNDPDNNSLMDVYLAVSSDGGRTFPVNTRVTTTNWPVLPTSLDNRPGYHGDYNKVVASDNNFYIAWGDDRSGLDPDVYMAAVPTTGSSPDFVLSSTRALADVPPGGSAAFPITTGGAAGVKFSATASAPGLSLQFSGNTLDAGTTPSTFPGTYTIQVKGISGDGLERGTVVRLTVHAPDMPRVPVPVTPIRSPAYAGQAATDAAGNLHLVTVEDKFNRVNKRISYRRIPAGRTDPEPPQTIFRADPDPSNQSVSFPRIAADSKGAVYIVWRSANQGASDILFSSSSNGRDFSTPQNISGTAAPLTLATRPNIAIAGDGTVFVSFIKQTLRESRPNVFALVSTDLFLISSSDGGATFSDAVNVSRYNSASRTVSTTATPALVLDADGQPHLAWRSSQVDIFYCRSSDGGKTFSAVVNASQSADSVSPAQPSLVVDAQKNVYIAWTSPDDDLFQQDIMLSKSSDGATFDKVSNISFGTFWTGAFADWPALGVDSAGTLTAAWRQLGTDPVRFNDPQFDMFYARSSDGGLHWSAPVNFTNNLGESLLGGSFGAAIDPPSIPVGPDGRASIFYDDDTGGGTQIWMLQLP